MQDEQLFTWRKAFALSFVAKHIWKNSNLEVLFNILAVFSNFYFKHFKVYLTLVKPYSC
jgi:hypothetical protein